MKGRKTGETHADLHANVRTVFGQGFALSGAPVENRLRRKQNRLRAPLRSAGFVKKSRLLSLVGHLRVGTSLRTGSRSSASGKQVVIQSLPCKGSRRSVSSQAGRRPRSRYHSEGHGGVSSPDGRGGGGGDSLGRRHGGADWTAGPDLMRPGFRAPQKNTKNDALYFLAAQFSGYRASSRA